MNLNCTNSISIKVKEHIINLMDQIWSNSFQETSQSHCQSDIILRLPFTTRIVSSLTIFILKFHQSTYNSHYNTKSQVNKILYQSK